MSEVVLDMKEELYSINIAIESAREQFNDAIDRRVDFDDFIYALEHHENVDEANQYYLVWLELKLDEVNKD